MLDLQAHTIGGVIAAGEPIMDIVPGDDDLVIAAQVQPQDIDKIQVGSEARIRLSAFNELPADTAEQLNDLSLVPGMPAESFIRAGERTAISYLLKPLTDSFARLQGRLSRFRSPRPSTLTALRLRPLRERANSATRSARYAGQRALRVQQEWQRLCE